MNLVERTKKSLFIFSDSPPFLIMCRSVGLATAVLLCIAVFAVHARIAVDQRITPGGHTVLTPSDDDREVQCVNDYLCIGNINAACNADHLRDAGVTHVISLIGDVDCAPKHIPRTLINVWDAPYQDMTAAFSSANDVINQVHADHGRVLVHCAAGVSRSSSTIIYHLMREHNMSYADALARVRVARHVAQPNAGFEHQLRALDHTQNEAKHEL